MMKFGWACLALTLAIAGWVEACVGARPLAMGGAFVAVADDVHATYWNPAGLLQIPPGSAESTFMHTATNRDSLNYQDYFAIATRVARRPYSSSGGYALGASYILNNRVFLDTTNGQLIEDKEHWAWVSFAGRIAPGITFGVNGRAVIDDTPPGYPMSTGIGLDLGFLYRANDRLSVGLLIQNANQPTKTYVGVPFLTFSRNWRPGIAYRPTPESVIALDAYDLADEAGYRSLRLGGELDKGRFVFRAGYHGFGGSRSPRSATFGFGMRSANNSLDLALLAGDLDNTLIVSASRRL